MQAALHKQAALRTAVALTYGGDGTVYDYVGNNTEGGDNSEGIIIDLLAKCRPPSFNDIIRNHQEL